MQIPVPVIVVAFNRPEYSQVCLDSLYEADPGCLIWPVVVDNGSRKKTRTALEDWAAKHDTLPESKKSTIMKPTLLRKEANGGFAGGVNEGLRAVLFSEEFGPTVILHNDTVVFDNWAGEMKACLDESEEEVAVVVPRTNYANEHQMCVEELRKKFVEVKPNNKFRITMEEIRALLEGLYGKGTKVPELIKNETLRTSYCSELASFCMMIRPSFLRLFPKWDEEFFPRGYEDKFWFLPAERDGYVCMISNRSFVHHFGNITSDGPGFFFHEMFRVNNELFFRKVREMDNKVKLGNNSGV